MDARDELLSLSRWLYERYGTNLPQYLDEPAADAPRPALHLHTIFTGIQQRTASYYDDEHTHQIMYRPATGGMLEIQRFYGQVTRELQRLRAIPGFLHDWEWFRPAAVVIAGSLPAGQHYLKVAAINGLGQETLPSPALRVNLTAPGGVRIFPLRYPPGSPLAARHAIYYSTAEAGPYRLVTELADTGSATRPALELLATPPDGRAPLAPGSVREPNSVVFYRVIRIEQTDADAVEDHYYPDLQIGTLRLRTCSTSVRPLVATVPIAVIDDGHGIPPLPPPTVDSGGGSGGSGGSGGGESPPPIGTVTYKLIDP